MFKIIISALLITKFAFAFPDMTKKDFVNECIQASEQNIVDLKLAQFCHCDTEGNKNPEICVENPDYMKVCMDYFLPGSRIRPADYVEYCNDIIKNKNGILFDKRLAISEPVKE